MKPSANLYEHQKKAVEHILNNKGNGALFMEVGTGKTLTALSCFHLLDVKHLIVVCPLSLINAAWGEDIKKFTDYSYCNLRKNFTKTDIYIINFESYKLKKYQDIINSIDDKMIVVDESQKMKNHKSAITKELLKNKHNYRYKIVMTGTPAPNSELEYWAQMRLISNCLPESFYKFRNSFFHLERNGQVFHGNTFGKSSLQAAFSKGFKYSISNRKRSALMERISPKIFWVKKKDCLDLPEQVDEVREVNLSPYQLKTYRDMKRHMIAEIDGNHIVANVALTKIMKLRQITSGFAIGENDTLELNDNSKLNVLEEILESIGDQQAIIWIQFHKEVEIIQRILKSYTTLYSKTKDKDASIQDFKSGNAQYLIAHPKSGGHGLTFTNCSTSIYFSLDYSFESLEQSRGRIHRPGQNKKCTYIYLLAKGTIDEEIYQAVKNKENLQRLYERIRNSK